MKAKDSTTSKSVSKTAADNKITFEYFAPEARKVQLVGSFNNWSSSETELKKDKTGRWQISLALPPGRYEYRYLVDGNWQNDQRPIKCVKNPYGSLNSVIEVPKKTM